MQIITGYTGENHVTSMDDASLYRGIFGQGDYVLDVGNKFAATIIDNNAVRIMDGDLVIQGHQGRIRANDYEEVTIDNGTPGQKRNDLIVARYQKNTTTGIESISLEVVKGTPGETATDPDIIQEDLSTGGTQRDFALYRVSLNGLVLENVTSLFTVIPNLKDFMTHMAEDSQKHITESGENANGRYVRFDDGTMICTQLKNIENIVTTSSTVQGLTIYRSDGYLAWTFPAQFKTKPSVSMSTYLEKTGGYAAMEFFQRHFGITTVDANMQVLSLKDFDKASHCNYIAIGKWK